jgi:hypothetical protein
LGKSVGWRMVPDAFAVVESENRPA